jgi:hypothetical protein
VATEVVHWCDYHLNDEAMTRVVATQVHTVTIDRTSWTLELCGECWTKHVEPYASLVAMIGTRLKADGSAPAPVAAVSPHSPKFSRDNDRASRKAGGGSKVCPHCGREFANRQGLAVHGMHEHGAHNLVELFGGQPEGDA